MPDHAVGLWVRSADRVRRNQDRGAVVARALMLVELLGGMAVIVLGNLLSRLVGRQRWWRVPYCVDATSG